MAEQRPEEAARLCREGLERFRQEGAEEFAHLLAWVTAGEERRRHLDEVVARRPHHAWARVLLGGAKREAGDDAGAIEEYSRAIEANPRLAVAWGNRGAVRLLRKDAKALEDLDEAARLDPASASHAVNRAVARWGRGEVDGAREEFDRAVAVRPGSPRARSARGTFRRAQGDLKGAVEDLREAIRRRSGDAAAHLERGRALLDLGRGEEALGDFDEAARLAGESAVTLAGRAGALRLSGEALARSGRRDEGNARLTEAWGSVNRALELDGSLAGAHLERGQLNLLRPDAPAALADFGRAAELDPRDPRPWFFRGTIRAESDGDRAIRDFEEAIRRAPRYAPALLARGILREEKGELDAAVADYDAALAALPDYPDALAARGECRMKQRRWGEAVADLSRALEVVPQAWNSRERTARLLSEAKKN